MKEIKVYFSDGSVRVFHEEQTFMALNVFPNQDSLSENYMGQSKMYGLWSHIHDGPCSELFRIVVEFDILF